MGSIFKLCGFIFKFLRITNRFSTITFRTKVMAFQKNLCIPQSIKHIPKRFKYSPKISIFKICPNISQNNLKNQKSLNKTPFYGSPQPREGNLPGKHNFFKCMFTKMWFFCLQTTFFMVLSCSWVSWHKNDTERSRNFFKKQILNPKHAESWFLHTNFYSFRNAQDQSPRRFVTEPPNLLPVRTCRSSMKLNRRKMFHKISLSSSCPVQTVA